MIPICRAVSLLAVMALGACTAKQHPVDQYLSELRPMKVVPIAGMDWPAGTVLCPLTPYQSALPASVPAAKRVNGFLKRKQFAGDEDHWSLIVIRPILSGDEGIEHLVFKRSNYDVVTEADALERAAEPPPKDFQLQACVVAEHARILVTRTRGQRNLISFGTE